MQKAFKFLKNSIEIMFSSVLIVFAVCCLGLFLFFYVIPTTGCLTNDLCAKSHLFNQGEKKGKELEKLSQDEIIRIFQDANDGLNARAPCHKTENIKVFSCMISYSDYLPWCSRTANYFFTIKENAKLEFKTIQIYKSCI